MAEMTQHDEHESDLRSKLLKRLGIAGVMVVLLLGILAYFDRMAAQREEPTPKVFTEPVPVAPKKELSQPVKPAEPELPATETKPEQQASAEAQAPVATTTETTVPTTVKPGSEPDKMPGAVTKPTPATGGKPVATAKPVAGVKPVPEATSAPVTVLPSKPQRSASGEARACAFRQFAPLVVRLCGSGGRIHQCPFGRRIACQTGVEWNSVKAGGTGASRPLQDKERG